MTAALGGFEINTVEWSGHMSITVTVQTSYADRYFQLYAGRRLIGVSSSIGQTQVVGQLQPAHCPHCLTIVMCEEGDQLTDWGAFLPTRPFNQFQMGWQADDFPADAKWFELTSCAVADGAVDPDTVVAKVAYQGDGQYSFLFPPITAPGDWTYRVTPRDDAAPAGNAGDPADITEYALPYPPDILQADDGTRLTIVVNAGNTTVDFEYDW